MSSSKDQLQVIEEMLAPLMEEDMFLVSLKIKPTNNIKIYVDADNGLPIDKCIKINRALYKKLEEAAMYEDGNFSLEVSSPGIDEPLKLTRQFKKNIGRNVELVLKDEAQTVLEGKLIAVKDDGFSVEYTVGKGKKAVTEIKVFNFEDVKQTTVQIKF